MGHSEETEYTNLLPEKEINITKPVSSSVDSYLFRSAYAYIVMRDKVDYFLFKDTIV